MNSSTLLSPAALTSIWNTSFELKSVRCSGWLPHFLITTKAMLRFYLTSRVPHVNPIPPSPPIKQSGRIYLGLSQLTEINNCWSALPKFPEGKREYCGRDNGTQKGEEPLPFPFRRIQIGRRISCLRCKIRISGSGRAACFRRVIEFW